MDRMVRGLRSRPRCGDRSRSTSVPGWPGCARRRRSCATTCRSTSPEPSPTSRHLTLRRSWSHSRVPISRESSSIGRMGIRPPMWRIRRSPPPRSQRGRDTDPSARRYVVMLDLNPSTHRRGFLGRVATAAAAVGLRGLIPGSVEAQDYSSTVKPTGDASYAAWLNGIKGKYKHVYDAVEPNGGFSLIWAHVFLLTGTA